MWKLLILACLAVGIHADLDLANVNNELNNFITKLCKASGAEDKTEDIKKAVTSFFNCGKALIDPEAVKIEIEEAKPRGALDEVFKKYCDKSPQLKTCIQTLVTAATPSIGVSFREHTGVFTNNMSQLIDFVCHKDGDRIAMFVAEKGPECIESKSSDIRTCFENSWPGLLSSVADAKKLTTEELCAKLDQLSSCAVEVLERCEGDTPANMADALFRFIRKSSPCAPKKE